MRTVFAIVLCSLFIGSSIAQRKMPHLSFLHMSVAFADANKSFSDVGQLTDTLRDEYILDALAKILLDNPNLQIELAGHCAMNEDSVISIQRAEMVRDLLVAKGVNNERMRPVGYGHEHPVISDEIIFSLSSRIERDEANLRNRRVEVKVVGNKPSAAE